MTLILYKTENIPCQSHPVILSSKVTQTPTPYNPKCTLTIWWMKQIHLTTWQKAYVTTSERPVVTDVPTLKSNLRSQAVLNRLRTSSPSLVLGKYATRCVPVYGRPGLGCSRPYSQHNFQVTKQQQPIPTSSYSGNPPLDHIIKCKVVEPHALDPGQPLLPPHTLAEKEIEANLAMLWFPIQLNRLPVFRLESCKKFG